MTTLHVLRADLTLSVKNLFEDTVLAARPYRSRPMAKAWKPVCGR